jgi:hypothetical protein
MKKFLINFLKKFGYALVKIKKENSTEILEIQQRTNEIITKISPDNIILNGPFKGTKYITKGIAESTILPKIVGSYEAQLHDTVNEVAKKNYSDIVDIGCAEGYYAIGFAKKMRNTMVHCFDINKSDILICQEIAKLNNLTNLTFNFFCTNEMLKEFQFKNKVLVFCDTEGFELELFTEDVIHSLKKHDLLIEIHDINNPEISNTLYNRFIDTHNIKILDNRGIKYIGYEGLDSLTDREKEFAFFEHRGGYNMNIKMEWYYLTSKLANEYEL